MKQWMEKDTVLKFHGVDSAFDVWVNGNHVGFGKVSRLPSEFDITGFVKTGENDITVRVYKWSDGTISGRSGYVVVYQESTGM